MHPIFLRETKLTNLSIPLLLRLFEFIHETKNLTDEDLHFMAERISELAWDGVHMTMNEYQSIVPKKVEQKVEQKVATKIYKTYTNSEVAPNE